MGGPGSGRGSGGRRKRAGRPPGAKNVLPAGAVKAIQAAKRADLEDPMADEAMGVVLGIMRDVIRVRGFTRLAAAREVLDRKRGKPHAAEPPGPPDPGAPSWSFPAADAVSVDDALAGNVEVEIGEEE